MFGHRKQTIGVSQGHGPVLSFCVSTACQGVNKARRLGVTACLGSFSSCHGENHPNPKSGPG